MFGPISLKGYDMTFKTSWLLAASAAVLTMHGQAQAASVINQSYNVNSSASGALTNSVNFNYSVIDIFQDVTVGSVSSTIVGRFGADARASIGAVLKFSGGVNLSTPVSTGFSNAGSVRAFSGLDEAGRSVALINNITGQGIGKTTFGNGAVKANFDTQIFAGAKLTARACIVGCVGGAILDYSVGDPDPFRILGYDSTTNTTTFLGNTSQGALPRHFDGGGGLPISAELNALNLSGTTTTGNVTSYHSQQRLAGAFIDVAGVVANKFGVPQAALHGSKFGFDYTTISAKVGIALNAVYDSTVQLGAVATDYIFSHSVELFNASTGLWTAVGRQVKLNTNQFSGVRPVDPNVQSISVLPIAVQAINIAATLDLQAVLEDHIRVLELHGNGLDAGPLFAHDGSIVLGSIGQFRTSQGLRARTALQPFTLDFAGSSGTSPPGGEVGGRFVFIANPVDVTNVNANTGGLFALAMNFGRTGCDDKSLTACEIDPTIAPIFGQRMASFDALGNPTFSYSTSFNRYNAITGLEEGTYGEQWTTEQLLASLQGLRHPDSGYELPPQIAFNTDPWLTAGVPEPANWALMIAGFGFVGGALRKTNRRLRAKVRVTYA